MLNVIILQDNKAYFWNNKSSRVRKVFRESFMEVNKVIKFLEKSPLGMTLPEMAGGTRQIKKMRTLRPLLAQALADGLIMPVSQRAGHTVYRLVKYLVNR